MKRLTGRIAAVLLTLILLLTSISVPAYAAQKEQKPRAIAIVFDNSYSMYRNNEKAWCRATYAMEVFAAMLNDGDTLMIYPMHPITVEGQKYSQEKPLTITDPSQSAKIRKIYTDDPQGTPIECLDAAAAGLRKTNVAPENKWLIVLTDGTEFYKDDEELTTEQTKAELGTRVNAYVGDMNVQYLGIQTADPVSTPNDPPSSGYTEKIATNSADVLSVLTGMCNQIFGRDTIPASRNRGGKLNFDISMKKLIVFVQGENVSDVSVTGANGPVGTLTASPDVHYAENGAGDRAEGNCVSDTSLQGMLVTYTDCPAGEYTVSYSGTATSIEAYYEPDADLDFVFTDENGTAVDPDQDLYEGQYKVSYGIKDAKTGELIDSDLLGEPVYDGLYSLDGNKDAGETTPIRHTGMSGEAPVTLKLGNIFYAKMTVTYLSGYTITKDSLDFGWPELGLPIVPKPVANFALTISPDDAVYPRAKLEEGEPFRVDVSYDNRPLTGSELEKVTLAWDEAISNAAIEQTLAEDHFELKLRHKDPDDPSATVCGPCTVPITATYTAPGSEEAKTSAPLSYTIEDPSDGLKVELTAPQDYFVIAEIDDGESLRADITYKGERINDEDLKDYDFTVDCEGLEFDVQPIAGESAYSIRLLSSNDPEAGRYKVTATAKPSGNTETTGSSDTAKIELSTMPEWLRTLLIVIPILLLLLLLIYLLFFLPVMPKIITGQKKASNFTISGDEIGGGAKISNGKKYGKTLTVEPPKTSNYVYSFAMRLQMKPMDPITKPSSKRRVKVEESSIISAIPSDVNEVMVGGTKFVRDEETRKIVRKGAKSGGGKKGGDAVILKNMSPIKMSGTAKDRKNRKLDSSFATKLVFK